MESDDFTRHYIIRYLSARELVLPPPALNAHPNSCLPEMKPHPRKTISSLVVFFFYNNSAMQGHTSSIRPLLIKFMFLVRELPYN